ncbi:diphthine methyl ester synthase-like [Clytia hemisphaerica]|uniref:diphthine methyl ester synthase n=1 Tax=Clytia hemisphaerica TaxID=252671 RepID=A0A7M5URQ7_9CNID
MLYLIGLGLGDAKDITVKGLEAVKKADQVFLEAYTSILTGGKEALEQFYGREVILADRTLVEQESDTILENAKEKDVVFLVVGDPLGATTHTDLVIRAVEKNIKYKIIHNASIMNAAGCCGLQLYNFGETVSIVMWNENWKPKSFFEKIAQNKKRGLHTLCLLDIKVKEQSVENMMRGRKIYEPPRYLTANDAIQQILEIVQSGDEEIEGKDLITEDSFCVALARIGWEDQQIFSGKMSTVRDTDLGPPIHSLVIPGDMHFIETDMLKLFAIQPSEFAGLPSA